MSQKIHKEPSEVEKALKMVERLTEQSARRAMVEGAIAQLKLDERWVEGLPKLLEASNPRVRDIGRFLNEGVPPSVACWLAMNDGTQAGHGGGKLDSETVDLIISLMYLAIDARLAPLAADMVSLKATMANSITKRDLMELMAELREQTDPVLFLQKLARLKRAFQDAGIAPANSLPPTTAPDATRRAGGVRPAL